MPGYGYAGGGNPFEQGFENGSGFINNSIDVQKRIQDAYIAREANERAKAKQQHDFAVDDLETRMKLLGSGAQPVSADGGIGISGQLAQAGTPSGPVVQPSAASSVSVPGGLPDSMAQMPPQLSPQASPDMSTSQRIMGAGTQYKGQAPADPNLTVKAPDGKSYQLPSLEQRAGMQDAADTRAAKAEGMKSQAQEGGKKQADAEDLKKNGIDVPDALATYLGIPTGQKATLANLHQMVQDTSTRKHNETLAAQAAANEIDRQAHDHETERHNQATEESTGRRLDIIARNTGANGEKPMTAGQRGVQNRADTSQLRKLQAEEFDLNDQRRKLGVGVSSGAMYFDNNGKAKALDPTDQETPALIEEMKARHEAAGQRIAEIVDEKNEITQRLGGTPKVSGEQAAAAMRRGSLTNPAASGPAQNPTATAPAAATPAKVPATSGPKIAKQSDIAAFAKEKNIPIGQASQIFAAKGWTIAR